MNEELISKSLVSERMIYNAINDVKYNYKVTINYNALQEQLVNIVCIISKLLDALTEVYLSIGFISFDGVSNNINLETSELDNIQTHVNVFKEIVNNSLN